MSHSEREMTVREWGWERADGEGGVKIDERVELSLVTE